MPPDQCEPEPPRIIHGDCLDVLPDFADASFDAVITDPPYPEISRDYGRMTEADWRAFPTLLRFDLVYYSHFKCNLRRLQDYPNLMNYLRELYQWPGITDTLDLDATKQNYYAQAKVNPTCIYPAGPDMSFLDQPHDRARLPRAA